MDFVSLILVFVAWQGAGPEQLFQEAVAAQQQGNDGEAIGKYQQLLKLRPGVVEVRANLGAALAHAGRLDEALVQYKAALANAPDNKALRMNFALAYYKKNDWADAAVQFGLLHRADAGDARITTLLGACYGHLGRSQEAIALLRPLESAHPDSLDVEWALGTAYMQAGQWKEARNRFDRVAHQGQSAEAYVQAGNASLGLNEFEPAKSAAETALRLNPNQAGAQTLLGRALEYLGDEEGAKTALAAALDARPDDFEAHLTLGAILNTQRDLANARMHLVQALKLHPKSSLARYEMAKVERAQDELQAAAADLEQVTRADPDWLQPHVELAALYYRLKRPLDGKREREIVDRLTAEQERGRVTAPPPSL